MLITPFEKYLYLWVPLSLAPLITLSSGPSAPSLSLLAVVYDDALAGLELHHHRMANRVTECPQHYANPNIRAPIGLGLGLATTTTPRTCTSILALSVIADPFAAHRYCLLCTCLSNP